MLLYVVSFRQQLGIEELLPMSEDPPVRARPISNTVLLDFKDTQP